MPEPKAVSFCTVGCRLNQFETNDLERQFTERGWRVVPFGSPADACVVNTCTVTARSDSRCRQALRRARRTSPGAAVVAVGCYAQAQAGRLAEMPEVDLVLGNREKGALFEHLDGDGRPRGGRVGVVATDGGARTPFVPIRAFSGHTRAFVKIQDGCDAACSYCIVPRARGPNRSLPEEAVIAQIETLVQAGYREIVLSGVHLGSWGRDLDGPRTLAALLERTQSVAGLERLRLSSIEPTEFTPELLAVLAAAPRICPHFHVPLQSGSACVLRAMRRPYGPERFAAVVGRLAAARPAAGIGADVIAGFPGESEEHHEETAALIRSLPLTYLHVFPFSRRPGTPAADLPGHLPREERERRAEELRRLGREKAEAFRARHVGTTVRVLVERQPQRGTGLACGLTDNYLRVVIDAPADALGRFRTVNITRLEEGTLHGTIV